MISFAAVVLVTGSVGMPVSAFHCTRLNLKPSGGDLFHEPWKATYAAVLLALNLMSSGAVCAAKHRVGDTRLAQSVAVFAVPCAMMEPVLSWVFRGEGRTVGSHTVWHCRSKHGDIERQPAGLGYVPQDIHGLCSH